MSKTTTEPVAPETQPGAIAPDVGDDTKKPAAKAAAKPAAPKVERVIIQRPHGETNSHQFVGFNSYERQIKYDEPVTMPSEVVAYLRSLKRVEYRAGADGMPEPSYSNLLSVVDAPAEAG